MIKLITCGNDSQIANPPGRRTAPLLSVIETLLCDRCVDAGGAGGAMIAVPLYVCRWRAPPRLSQAKIAVVVTVKRLVAELLFRVTTA